MILNWLYFQRARDHFLFKKKMGPQSNKISVYRDLKKGEWYSGIPVLGINLLPVLEWPRTVGRWECANAREHDLLGQFWYVINVADLGGQGLSALSARPSPGQRILLAVMNSKATARKCSFKFLSKFSWQTRENERKRNSVCFNQSWIKYNGLAPILEKEIGYWKLGTSFFNS